SFDVGGLGAGGTAGVSYGIGANAGADVSLGKDGIHVSANLGVTFGLGANVKLDLSVNPADIPGASLVTGAIGDVVHSDVAKSVVHDLNPTNWF
ncbi:MAG TPA: hypothetical protein VJR25_10870, partial [Microbacterium sp.]|uniref:hypothetical protein n=1 Tax=Microbacterium sp. TaxID=51671 RepID=UPI002B495658